VRINFTLYRIDPFGGHRTWWYVGNRLCERGHKVTITLMEKQDRLFAWHPDVKFIYAYSGHDLHSVARKVYHGLGLAKFRRSYRWVKDFLYRDVYNKRFVEVIPDCDISVANFYTTAFIVSDSRKGVPIHHLQHFEDVFIAADDEYSKKRFRDSFALPIKRTVNSIWCRDQVETHFGIKSPVINPGIEHGVFHPRKDAEKSGKLRVLAFGKDLPLKGFADILKAMAVVKKEIREVELVVFGAKPVGIKGDVDYDFRLSPSDEDLARLYSSADAFISASWFESFPGPPLEAMACGCPVVTTRYGTEDYAVDGINSLVVMPKDASALAHAVLTLLNDDAMRRRFREAGIETAKRFTWDATTDRFEEYFSSLVR
jgi:glycosyltransferase involved in cell wall biosynthesis